MDLAAFEARGERVGKNGYIAEDIKKSCNDVPGLTFLLTCQELATHGILFCMARGYLLYLKHRVTPCTINISSFQDS